MVMAWRNYYAGTVHDARMISLRVLQLEPKNPDALHLLGILAYQSGQQDQAIDFITEAIRSNKKHAPMHGNLALAKLGKGDLNGAAASARRAFALSPSYADAHRVLGLVYYKKGNIQKAVEEFRRALGLGLDTEDLHKHLASALEDLAAGTTVVTAGQKVAPDG
jgi:Tfp pilus assembly protein PilF